MWQIVKSSTSRDNPISSPKSDLCLQQRLVSVIHTFSFQIFNLVRLTNLLFYGVSYTARKRRKTGQWVTEWYTFVYICSDVKGVLDATGCWIVTFIDESCGNVTAATVTRDWHSITLLQVLLVLFLLSTPGVETTNVWCSLTSVSPLNSNKQSIPQEILCDAGELRQITV